MSPIGDIQPLIVSSRACRCGAVVSRDWPRRPPRSGIKPGSRLSSPGACHLECSHRSYSSQHFRDSPRRDGSRKGRIVERSAAEATMAGHCVSAARSRHLAGDCCAWAPGGTAAAECGWLCDLNNCGSRGGGHHELTFLPRASARAFTAVGRLQRARLPVRNHPWSHNARCLAMLTLEQCLRDIAPRRSEKSGSSRHRAASRSPCPAAGIFGTNGIVHWCR